MLGSRGTGKLSNKYKMFVSIPYYGKKFCTVGVRFSEILLWYNIIPSFFQVTRHIVVISYWNINTPILLSNASHVFSWKVYGKIIPMK